MTLESRIARIEHAIGIETADEDFTEFELDSGEVVRISAGLSLVDIAALVSARSDQEHQE